ncbi:MAG: anaerobic ribonucleoside-triphosphate reductase activating protein [Bacteroidales bacterium]|nr:anaerobic ribonucleoside-triphosphate reductase activating protein [Bacteroidales bacterium]
MLKYLNTDIVFQEIPDEVTLAINLTGCPCHCPGCHSPYLWNDTGNPLTPEALDKMIADCKSNITCVALMGGDAIPDEVNELAGYVRTHHTDLHTAWYSGRSLLAPHMEIDNFDYIKLGPYLRHLGSLRYRSTNQRMYKVTDGKMKDITSRFWRNDV